MFALSLTTLRDRWTLFVGAIVTVTIGVALVQASLLTLIAAATADIAAGLPPTEDLLVRNGYESAISMMGMILFISGFVAMFIVGSTFAFTVAQRRRDLALLRLVGASRRQVQRLLVGEAVLLGAVGTGFGVALGFWVAGLEADLLIDFGFVPAGFTVAWRSWILAVSAGVGIGIAVAGSLGAARRAGQVRPLAALRATAKAERVMTFWRWIIGIIATAGAIAMMIISSAVGNEGALALSTSVCLVWIVALAALSPVIVPVVGGLVGLVSRLILPYSRLGELIHANLRDGVRRSSSTATPVMLLIGLLVGLSGAMDVMAAGSATEMELTLDGDLMVTATGDLGDELAAIPGVKTVSEEASVIVGVDEERGESQTNVAVLGVAIDPLTYPQTHRITEVEGDIARLDDGAVVLSRGLASTLGSDVDEMVTLQMQGVDQNLLLVATLRDTLAGPEVLLPLSDAAPGEPHRYIVQTASPAAAGAVAAEIAAMSPADPDFDVVTMDEWIDAAGDAEERTSRNIIIAIVGLAALYSAIAVVNAVVIAAAGRREEFAIARLSGLSRAQVVRAALWESLTVTTAGVLLGGAVAAGTVLGATAAVSEIVGRPVEATPWSLFALVTATATVLVIATSLATTLAATRMPPVAVAGARQ
ncbi:MAG: FtsX-like permease family protein [Actinomycetia bacterium]|nr:FtsX-like permease family protein [Actinomycetes bacterium]